MNGTFCWPAWRRFTALLLLVIAPQLPSVAHAATITLYEGRLNDPADPALVGSGPSPSAALFIDDFAIANNVAVYAFAVPFAGTVRFQSIGYALGGLDPYFSLFDGTGGFVASNFVQAFSTGGDFDLLLSLAAGAYTFGIGAFANLSFAENTGAGTLADGFTGLGQPDLLRDYRYALAVTIPDAGGGSTVPEPSTPVLVAAGLLVVSRLRRTTRQRVGRIFRRVATAPRPRFGLASPEKEIAMRIPGRLDPKLLALALPVLATLLVVQDAAAQVRPAYTKNVDERGRVPYAFEVEFTPGNCGSNCFNFAGNSFSYDFDAPAVPAGKRLVIESVSAILPSNQLTNRLAPKTMATNSVTGAQKWAYYGPYFGVPGGLIAGVGMSSMAFVTYGPGESPHISLILGNRIGIGGSVTLSGYLIDAVN